MLLSQTFKTGSSVAVGNGRFRHSINQSVLPGTTLSVRRKIMTKPVSASSSSSDSGRASPGWLESKLGKATSYVDKKLQGDGKPATAEETVEIKGTAIVVKKLWSKDIVDRVADRLDDFSEITGKHVYIQLMSGGIDSSTGEGKLSDAESFAGWANLFESVTAEQIKFDLKFTVPKSFGTPVAIVVKNTHPNEFLLESFVLDLPDKSVAHYITNSWVFNTEKTKPIGPRIFFHNKAYLPADTPAALKALREKELQELRGDGTGERIVSDRIYDYDIYNDLGRPDDAKELKRTADQADRVPLGGNKEYPFPRRMRTGRPYSKIKSRTETRPDKVDFYVPSDERFDYRKQSDNDADKLRSIAHAAGTVAASKLGKVTFDSVKDIKKLYAPKGKNTSNKVLPGKADGAVEAAADTGGLRFLAELRAERSDGEKGRFLHFAIPQIIKESDNVWATDSEFARENLAGFNPIEIKRVTEFPIKSGLDPAKFRSPESAISAKDIEGELEGLTIEQALSEKKLFTMDHHDTFLPWVERINALPNSKTYASRVLFFLNKDETLKVLAIELVLPPTAAGGDNKSVFLPPKDPSKKDTSYWLWVLAKAHAMSNEMTKHQAVNHFTLCHVVTEPAIIAAHRNLSKLHPIMQLVHPHFKHTLFVNATARMNLIQTDGTIELIYTPREYVIPMSCAYYRDNWSFEKNALPKDLISRGMAEADPSAKHGVKLVIEDYPYAADGLELWSAMKEWHKEYIDIFYKDDSAVQADPELNNWWTEYRTRGHEDFKDAAGWPELTGKESLAEILTTLIWICTAMHAPINFGQYDYAAWMPNHPSLTRKLIPKEGSKDWKEFQADPEKFWLSTISDTETTVTAMAVFEVVAAHAPDEEYIGQRNEGWTASEQVKSAFKSYVDKLNVIDDNIVKRNEDKSLKNRCGEGNFPFQLLRPFSQPGVTAMGVPNSITV